MTRAVIAGSLQTSAEQRTGKNGAPYATCTIIETVGEGKRWWRAVAFGDSVDSLMALQSGEGVTVSGEISAEVYAPEGREARVSWSIKVDGVLTAQPQRKPKAAAKSCASPAAGGVYDDIPF